SARTRVDPESASPVIVNPTHWLQKNAIRRPRVNTLKPGGARAEEDAMRGVRPSALAAAQSALGVTRLRKVLPQGGSLPKEDWRRRHAGIMALLWGNVVVIPIYGVAAGHAGLVHHIDSGV